MPFRLGRRYSNGVMSDSLRLEIITQGPQETEAVGEHLGRALRGGEIIELSSDLGGGKTTLVRGVARGAGSSDVVSSPTFTISKVYTTSRLEIHHFDFYRLAEAGVMHEELAELVDDPQVTVLVEWSDIVKDVLPAARLTLRIERMVESEDARKLILEYPENLGYLVAAIDKN